jgi:SAM-dependent methyltransferase
VEIDPVAADLARPYCERVIVGDLDRDDLLGDLELGSFDLVLAADVLEHLRDPAGCLRAAIPLVRPGGSVLVSIPNVAHGDIRLALLQGRFDYQDNGLLDRTHIHLFTLSSLLDLLDEVGLVPIDWHRSVRPIGSTEIEIDETLLEFGRQAFAGDPEASTYQWIVRCRPGAVDAATIPEVPDRAVPAAVSELMNRPVARPVPAAPVLRPGLAPARRLVGRVLRTCGRIRGRVGAEARRRAR